VRVAILSDIHANIYALEAVLADCEKEEVGHFIVAGDLVGYYYWPRPVVQRLMHDARVTCIRGNHEDNLGETLDSLNAADRYRRKYGSGYDVCRESLCDGELQWLRHLPSRAELVLGGAHFSVHHGSPLSTDEYIYPDATAEVLERCHDSRDFTVLGHTHYPFVHVLGGRILLNPGSVGQPRDFGGQACYAVVDLANRALRFKRVPYDIRPVVAAAQARDPSLCYLHKILTRRVR
jgi:putative phosphoesterase